MSRTNLQQRAKRVHARLLDAQLDAQHLTESCLPEDKLRAGIVATDITADLGRMMDYIEALMHPDDREGA